MRKVNVTILLVISMALISIACLIFGVSYSYILSGGISNNQTITTGNLNANITLNGINYDNMTVTNDTDALSQNNTATISIKKENDYSVYFQIRLKYDKNSNQAKNLNQENLMPLENVKVALYDSKEAGKSTTPIVGPIAIADLPIANLTGEDPLSAEYELYSGKFENSKSEYKYYLKAWIDENTDPDFDGKIVSLDASVIQEPWLSKNIYNINAKVLNGSDDPASSNQPVSNAKIYLNGRLINANGDSNGTYNLTNIVEGRYSMRVEVNNESYETAFELLGGEEKKVQENASKSINKNTMIQKTAYENKTTVYQIMKHNRSLQNSNVSAPYDFEVPTSYTITGLQSLGVQEFGEIYIKLGTNGGIKLELNGGANGE